VASAPDVSIYASSLVISEIMYHPALPTAEEAALGFTEDDFEYIEIMNTAAATIDLTDVRFTKGVDVDFAPGTQLAPGAHLLIVRSPAAFEKRYGPGKAIAGSFPNDQLRNSGEEVKLSYGAGTEIRSVSYLDIAPWPTAADGQGPSLQLIAPQSRPDHTVPGNWQASLATQGSPGTADSAGLTFAAWATAFGLPADPATDSDGDGSSNKLEYALVTDARAPQSTPVLTANVESIEVAGTTAAYATLTFLRRTDSTDLAYIVEFSAELTPWAAGGTLLRSAPAGPGMVRETWRAPNPMAAQSQVFGRVRVP
jgi:hypothetical protein